MTTVLILAARAYITSAILEPDFYTVEGFPDVLMPTNFGDSLADEEIEGLEAYLPTLRKL